MAKQKRVKRDKRKARRARRNKETVAMKKKRLNSLVSAAVTVRKPKRKKKASAAADVTIQKPKRKRRKLKPIVKTTVTQIKGVKTMGKAMPKKTSKKRKAAIGHNGGHKKAGRRRSTGRSGGGIQKTLITGALMGGGAIAAALVANKVLPATMDKRLRALLPFVAGVAIHQFVKNEMAHNVAYGMMALGTLFLARELVPQLGLSGEGEIYIPQLPGTYQTMIGENEFSGADEFLGLPDDFGEDLEVLGVPESFGEEGQETDWKRKD